MEEKNKPTRMVFVIHISYSALIFFFVMLALVISGFVFLPDILSPEDSSSKNNPTDFFKETKQPEKKRHDYSQYDFGLSSDKEKAQKEIVSDSEVKKDSVPEELTPEKKINLETNKEPIPSASPSTKREFVIPADYASIDPTLFVGLPQAKYLYFDNNYSVKEQESLKSYYLKRIEALNLLRQYYAAWYLKYNNEEHPKFARFREIIVTYLSVEKERIKALEGMMVNKATTYKVEIMNNFDPEKEVRFRLSHVSKEIKLRNYKEIVEDGF